MLVRGMSTNRKMQKHPLSSRREKNEGRREREDDIPAAKSSHRCIRRHFLSLLRAATKITRSTSAETEESVSKLSTSLAPRWFYASLPLLRPSHPQPPFSSTSVGANIPVCRILEACRACANRGKPSFLRLFVPRKDDANVDRRKLRAQ